MRTSFHSAFLADYPVDEAVRMIRDHGYDQAELNAETLDWAVPHISPTTSRELRSTLAGLGPYSALSAHRMDLASGDPEVRDGGVAWTIAMLDLAVDLGIDVVHVIPGDGPDLAALYGSLSRIVEAGLERGIRVGLEAVVLQTIRDTRGVIDAVAAVPGLRVNFDPSHLQVHDGDVLPAARALGAFVDHVAIKDASGTPPSSWSFDPLGAGGVDFTGMIAALRSLGYDGTLSVEHESHLFGDDRGHSEVLRSSLEFVRDLIDGAPPLP